MFHECHDVFAKSVFCTFALIDSPTFPPQPSIKTHFQTGYSAAAGLLNSVENVKAKSLFFLPEVLLNEAKWFLC